ncbi:MAG: SLBB domain-containing protein [Sandaracinaceae bacterium]|nr:SLBB domain-containing protein [Sandaracinaceae bacterium]
MRPLLSVLVIAAFAACAPALPVAPAHPDGFQASQVETPPGLDPKEPSPFRLFPGDVLLLKLLSVDGAESWTVSVDARGDVSVPGYGEAHVGGETLTEAERLVEQRVRRLDTFARVALTLSDPGGHRASALGAFERPGLVVVRPGMKVSEVIASAGGPKTVLEAGESVDASDLDAGTLVRDGKALPLTFARALQGDPRHDVFVEPGDTLVLPSASGRRITVLGAVKTGRSFLFRRGMRLSEALGVAGGTTADADHGDVRVLRGPLSHPKVYRCNLRKLFAGEASDVELAPGDVIFVTESALASTSQVLQRLTPLFAATAVGIALAR